MTVPAPGATPPTAIMRAVRGLWRLPARLAILAVRGYQRCLSPVLGGQCRFHPSCSEYYIGAVEKHGFLWGSCRGAWRIMKCHPLHPGGYDPP